MALLLRLRGGREREGLWLQGRMVSLDVGESFELPHHTLLCSATGKTQEIISK